MPRKPWIVAEIVATVLVALVALAPPGLADGHRGGVLRLLAHGAAGSLDPKINYTLQY